MKDIRDLLKHIAYAHISLPEFPFSSGLREAQQLEYFPYREEGWGSVCLFGLEKSAIWSAKKYGLSEDKAPYKWCLESEAPSLTKWFKTQSLFEHYRARIWRLKSGRSIPEHRDDYESYHLESLIVPLNSPKGFTCKINGVRVPYEKGAFLINNKLPHNVVNDSNEDRYAVHLRLKNGFCRERYV